jgi:arsenate reductase-like glutaredoxin family protein
MRFEERLSVKPHTDREQTEKFCVQRQFIKGVRDGRVYAVCRPLEESKCVGAEEINDPSEYVNEVEKELESLGLDVKKDDADDELAEMMKDVGIMRDPVIEELERAWREQQAYEKGVNAGRGAQALLESQALGYEDPIVRKNMFERALW